MGNTGSRDNMVTFMVDSTHLNAMVKAMRDIGVPVKSERTTRLVTSPRTGEDIFRAMQGRNGTWLVSHHKELFL
jgi:uncharacterized protein with von Willebrand factor type A (vWA) domain